MWTEGDLNPRHLTCEASVNIYYSTALNIRLLKVNSSDTGPFDPPYFSNCLSVVKLTNALIKRKFKVMINIQGNQEILRGRKQ